MSVTDITGVILAGGRSSRMGRRKTHLRLGEKSFIEHIAGVLGSEFRDVVIVSNRQEVFHLLELPVYTDICNGCGPLGGIHAAFVYTGAGALFVASCDMPFLSPEIIREIIARSRSGDMIAIPSYRGELHPLCGLYRRPSLSVIERHLREKRYAMRNLASLPGAVIIPLDDRRLDGPPFPLTNINTPEQYKRAARQYS